MKETKKFFDNNRLNKGYSKISNFKQDDASVLKKQHIHMLPPIELVAEYEELYPGTMAKLISMAEKEQENRHMAELLAIGEYNKSVRIGKVFSLVFITLIAIFTLLLALFGGQMVASTFVLSSFALMAFVMSVYTKSPLHRKFVRLSENQKPHSRPERHNDSRKKR